MFHLFGPWDSPPSPSPRCLVAADVLRELREVRRLMLQNPAHLRVALATVTTAVKDGEAGDPRDTEWIRSQE